MNTRNQDEIVTTHAPLVKRIAYKLISRLPPSVQADDLIQAGMIGLLEASRNYDSGQGARFETYAGIRIHGAMLDEIRRDDWAPRSVYKKARKVADAVRKIEGRERRDARDHEVAQELKLTLDEYYKILQDASGYLVMSFEDMGVDNEAVASNFSDRSLGPIDKVENEAFKKCFSDAIARLPDREKLVVDLYYDEELNMREIGAVIGISESRVSQIHSKSLIRLQARLSQWLEAYSGVLEE